MGMVLAKVDLEIGRHYAEHLVKDADLRTRVFDRIAAEHERAARWHATITGSDDPLAGNPGLSRSIRNRDRSNIVKRFLHESCRNSRWT
jgi:phosphoenolpyruvate carboxylase